MELLDSDITYPRDIRVETRPPSITYTSTIKPPLRGLVRSIRKYTRGPHKVLPACKPLYMCPMYYPLCASLLLRILVR